MTSSDAIPKALPIEVCGVLLAEQTRVKDGIEVKGHLATYGARPGFCFVVPDGQAAVLRYSDYRGGIERTSAEHVEVVGSHLDDLDISCFQYPSIRKGSLRILDPERAHTDALYCKEPMELYLKIARSHRTSVDYMLEAVRSKRLWAKTSEENWSDVADNMNALAADYGKFLRALSALATSDYLAGVFDPDTAHSYFIRWKGSR